MARRKKISEAAKVMGRRAGVPGYTELEDLRSMPGEDGVLYRAIYGANDEQFSAAVEAEHRANVRENAHSFAAKYRPGRHRKAG